jgi:hypothetical protein
MQRFESARRLQFLSISAIFQFSAGSFQETVPACFTLWFSSIDTRALGKKERASTLTGEAVTKTRYQPNVKMSIGKILLWEATNGLLLIPVWIALVMLTRCIRGRPVSPKGIGFFRSAIRGKKFWRFTSG